MKRSQDVPRSSEAAAEKRIKVDVPPDIQHAASHNERPGRINPDSSITSQIRALRTRAEPTTPVEAAAALIALAIHESNGPVEDLSRALGRIAEIAQASSSEGLARQQLAQEVAICVESLQFHDRLTQQLTQVRNLLATLASIQLARDAAGRPLEGDPQQWLVLLENLRARFTSDSHRILFNLLLPESGGRASAPSLHANEGSVELF
jgi:hypothetical protein